MSRLPSILLLLLALLASALPASAGRKKFDREAAVAAYFQQHNGHLVGTPCPVESPAPRAVTWVQRVTIFERDGWACILCGSKDKLELDHAQALMNGGSNDPSNLWTLCDDCHSAKTVLDFQLRRERRELAQKLADPSYRPPLNAATPPPPPTPPPRPPKPPPPLPPPPTPSSKPSTPTPPIPPPLPPPPLLSPPSHKSLSSLPYLSRPLSLAPPRRPRGIAVWQGRPPCRPPSRSQSSTSHAPWPSRPPPEPQSPS